ncbi:MAG: S-layer homology domain-containing protein [Eubacteriales bacterium]|jgi:hypothetical protein|nr:S-layer homology domain-containing protein [Eubacteriales bacterium]
MMKKLLSLILCIGITISICSGLVFADSLFSDINTAHWAYGAIEALVNDGTVGGFEDGSFRPDKTVSRAEFVKMIGMGSTRRSNDFSDVRADHWGYEYIMTSGLEGDGNSFMPDKAIERDDVINLIWTRNGKDESCFAPSVITSQGKNKEAVAWAYATGILKGDDGYNLRLDESLTRAEAAVLIIRAREVTSGDRKYNFTDVIRPEILKAVFEGARIFETEVYEPDRVITNGEMAQAAVRLASEEFSPTYLNFDTETLFEHPAAEDIYIIGKAVLGDDKITKEFAQRPANMQDTVAAMVYAAIRQAYTPVIHGNVGNTYADVGITEENLMNVCLTFAYENGIHFYADGKLNPEKEVTMEDLAALLLQIDHLTGIQVFFTASDASHKFKGVDSRIRKALASYPENADRFMFIDEDLPNQVYTVPFAEASENNLPKKSFDLAREYKTLFTSFLSAVKESCENKSGAKLKINFYPSLVCSNDNGFTMRVKIEILENPNNVSLGEILHKFFDVENQLSASKGQTFFVDFVTGEITGGVSVSQNLAKVKQVITIDN